MGFFSWLKKPANTQTATAAAAAIVGTFSPQDAQALRVVGNAVMDVEANMVNAPGSSKKAAATALLADAARDIPNLPDLIDALVAVYKAIGLFRSKPPTSAPAKTA